MISNLTVRAAQRTAAVASRRAVPATRSNTSNLFPIEVCSEEREIDTCVSTVRFHHIQHLHRAFVRADLVINLSLLY